MQEHQACRFRCYVSDLSPFDWLPKNHQVHTQRNVGLSLENVGLSVSRQLRQAKAGFHTNVLNSTANLLNSTMGGAAMESGGAGERGPLAFRVSQPLLLWTGWGVTNTPLHL